MKGRFLTAVGTIIIISSLCLGAGGLSLVDANPVLADTVSDIKDGVTGSGGGGSKNSGRQITRVIHTVVNILLFFVGVFAGIMLVIAGIRFVTSNGDSNTVASARNTVLYAVVGLIVAFLAFAAVNFVVEQLT